MSLRMSSARAMVYGQAYLVAAMLWGIASADMSQEDALLLFKKALQDSSALQSWLSSSSACDGSWRGVDCNPAGDSVVSLSMEGGDFMGQIPDEIKHLTFLNDLTIRKTMFSGIIPNAISRLRNLKFLIMSDNPGLSGPFPQWVLNLPKLEVLNLSGNNLTGTLPGCNSTTVVIEGPLGSVTVTAPVSVLLPFNFTMTVPVPTIVVTPVNITLPGIPVIQNVSLPASPPPFPLDKPPLFITPTMNWTVPFLNLSTAPPFPNLSLPPGALPTLPPLPEVNLSFPALPPLPSDNPEFPGFPLQRVAPNFTRPLVPPISSITLPSTPSVSLPPIPGVGLLPPTPGVSLPSLPGVSLPPTPGVTSPSIPGVSLPPTPGVTSPSIPGVTSPSIPGVSLPPTPGVSLPPIPGVTSPSIPGVSLPPLPPLSLPNFTLPTLPPFPQVAPPNVTAPQTPSLSTPNLSIPPPPDLPSISPLLPHIPHLPPLPSDIPPLSSIFDIPPIPQLVAHNMTSLPPLPPLPEIVVPNATIPPFPSVLPPLPNFTTPEIPPLPAFNPPNHSMPRFPPLPSIPSIPPISNDMPSLPSHPNVTFPTFPNLTLPDVPPISSIFPRNLTLPPFPRFMPPNFTLPNIPGIGLPQLNFSFPTPTTKPPPIGTPPCGDKSVNKPQETTKNDRHLTEANLLSRKLAKNLSSGNSPHPVVSHSELFNDNNDCLTEIVPRKYGKMNPRFQKCSPKSKHCKCRKINKSSHGQIIRH